jgi:hypothetical protein
MNQSEMSLAINGAAALIELLLRWQATRPREFAEHAQEVAALRVEADRLKALPADYLETIEVDKA